MPCFKSDGSAILNQVNSTSGVWHRLESTGPQLSGEVLWAILFTVALQDVERLQTHRLVEEGNMGKEEDWEREIGQWEDRRDFNDMTLTIPTDGHLIWLYRYTPEEKTRTSLHANFSCHFHHLTIASQNAWAEADGNGIVFAIIWS